MFHRHRGHHTGEPCGRARVEERGDRDDRRFARGFFGRPGHDHGAEWEAHRRGRGGRSGRLFDHGELRYVVLALIAEKPCHGYEIIKAIEDRTAGTYSPSPGVIYPTLTMVEELGQATVTESNGKKLYAVTEEGQAWLAANRSGVDTAFGRMAEANAAHGGGPAPEIIRARRNLEVALHLRLGRGPLTEQQTRAIAAALDEAATIVERS